MSRSIQAMRQELCTIAAHDLMAMLAIKKILKAQMKDVKRREMTKGKKKKGKKC